MGLWMQPRSEKLVTLISKAGPNVVERAAMRTDLATRMHDTEHTGDDTTQEKLTSYNGTLPACRPGDVSYGTTASPCRAARRCLGIVKQ